MGIRKEPWDGRQTVQKGNVGEEIVQAFLESKGFVVYKPATDSAHPFDMLAVKDKRLCIAAEVKTKALRTYYQDTGINKSTYYDYAEFSEKHNMDIFVFFVDEHKREVYGNWLKRLEQPRDVKMNGGKVVHYPRDEKSKEGRWLRLYPYEAMQHVAWIDSNTAEKLKRLSSRNYKYGGK